MVVTSILIEFIGTEGKARSNNITKITESVDINVGWEPTYSMSCNNDCDSAESHILDPLWMYVPHPSKWRQCCDFSSFFFSFFLVILAWRASISLGLIVPRFPSAASIHSRFLATSLLALVVDLILFTGIFLFLLLLSCVCMFFPSLRLRSGSGNDCGNCGFYRYGSEPVRMLWSPALAGKLFASPLLWNRSFHLIPNFLSGWYVVPDYVRSN